MTGLPPTLDRVIGLSQGALDMLMPMHIWADYDGTIVQAGPTISKMLGHKSLRGKKLLSLVEVRRPIAARQFADLAGLSGQRLSLVLATARDLVLRGTLTVLHGGSGLILDISLGVSFARAVDQFELTLNDFSPCDQTIDLLYLHEANASTMRLSRRLSERLECARAEAEAQAMTDALTGLANRRAMDLSLARHLADHGTEFSILQIDLDFFKQVNDSHGHAAGDAVLEHVGRVLRGQLRERDLAARVGGDEFLVLLPDVVDRDTLVATGARLIERLEEPIHVADAVCRISASVGITRSTDYATRPRPDDMLADADAALYMAKRGGRGCAILHQTAPTRDAAPSALAGGLPQTARGA